jgi:hypothetical protein
MQQLQAMKQLLHLMSPHSRIVLKRDNLSLCRVCMVPYHHDTVSIGYAKQGASFHLKALAIIARVGQPMLSRNNVNPEAEQVRNATLAGAARTQSANDRYLSTYIKQAGASGTLPAQQCQPGFDSLAAKQTAQVAPPLHVLSTQTEDTARVTCMTNPAVQRGNKRTTLQAAVDDTAKNNSNCKYYLPAEQAPQVQVIASDNKCYC